jgi:hypothetical protein
MTIIENFAALSIKEQVEFAKTLLKTINSEKIFSDETVFEFQDVEADDLTGGLLISISHTDSISVSRGASWTAGDEEGAEEDPGEEADYTNSIFVDAKKALKTLSAVIEGYQVSLHIDDVDENYDVDAEISIDRISHEDSGIGSYEFWGDKGYDSHPYVEVDGTITRAYDCTLTLLVEPADGSDLGTGSFEDEEI